MNSGAAFSAAYSDWKLIRTRSVVQIILEVPVEQADHAYSVLGGMPLSGEEVWVGVARLNMEAKEVMPDTAANARHNNVSPASDTPDRAPPARARTPVAPDKRLAQRAGILCADPVFQRWLRETNSAMRIMNEGTGEQRAAEIVRAKCGVKSRSEIIPGTPEAEAFDRMVSQFTAWKMAPEMAR